MCGILAIIRSVPLDEGRREQFDERFAMSMRRLVRRGPDGQGRYDSPCGRATLGHARLAIQDLSEAGRQPMLSPDGRTAITFNGEIYNAPALRAELERAGARFRSRSDTEVLLHGFGRWGFEGLLSRLYGMYAFVILEQAGDSGDGSARVNCAAPLRVWASADHAGMKPLVWTCFDAGANGGGQTLAIASDADALRAVMSDPPELDPTGMCDVLSIGYCPAPRTVWRNVHKLAPGQAMVWQTPRRAGERASPPRILCHWSPPESVRDGNGGCADERFSGLFEEVIEDHLLSDVPVGLFLSAGLDSSSIAVALARRGGGGTTGGITAHTLSTGAHDDEFPTAAELAGRLRMPHRAVPFGEADVEETLRDASEAFDEPQGFSALLTATRIARRVREGDVGSPTRVVLAGDGGDEAFGGYSWHGAGGAGVLDLSAELPHIAMSDHGPMARAVARSECDAGTRARAAAMLGGLSYAHRYLRRVFPGFHPSEAAALLEGVAPGSGARYDAAKYADWLTPEDRPGLPHPRRAQRLDIRAFCAGSILPKIDRACMAVGLELRSPFLDRRVLDWALARAPKADRRGGCESKRPLRAYLRRAVEDGLAPESLLVRPKQGFSLRLPDRRPFTALAARGWLESTRLVRDSVVRRDYAAFLPAEDEAREVRLFTLCMMAAWYERRV